MKAKIFYLNSEAVEHFPHDAEPSFNLLKDNDADAFEHVGTLEFESSKPYDYVAEELFAKYNIGDNPLATPEGQEFLREVGASHTSMSVGDYIEFDDHTILIVDGCGFKELVV